MTTEIELQKAYLSLNQGYNHMAAECAKWKERALQAEAELKRLKEKLKEE